MVVWCSVHVYVVSLVTCIKFYATHIITKSTQEGVHRTLLKSCFLSTNVISHTFIQQCSFQHSVYSRLYLCHSNNYNNICSVVFLNVDVAFAVAY